jgi:hypothetical protein
MGTDCAQCKEDFAIWVHQGWLDKNTRWYYTWNGYHEEKAQIEKEEKKKYEEAKQRNDENGILSPDKFEEYYSIRSPRYSSEMTELRKHAPFVIRWWHENRGQVAFFVIMMALVFANHFGVRK